MQSQCNVESAGIEILLCTLFLVNMVHRDLLEGLAIVKYLHFCFPCQRSICHSIQTTWLTLKEPGFLDPSHSRGGGGFRPPPDLGNRLTKYQVCGTSG